MVKKKKEVPFLKKKISSKKILKKSKRATLDLRRGNVEPVKQHGFKEGEITNINFLFN